MQDLRLIGVHQDGGHLLLADEHGSRYRVPLDEALRAATRHHPAHARGQVPADVVAGQRPREVQALIRAGLSSQEVAERCGWPLEKVHKYEVPILAEREYVAGLARLVRLRSRGGATASPTLAGRVAERLETRGVDVDEVSWDAWRLAGAEWTVVLTFPAGGKQREATWGFDPSTHAIHPRDDEARWFSEDDQTPATHVLPREVPVYDVEAEGGVGADSPPDAASDPTEQLDLVTAMRQRTSARSRRGARRRPAENVAFPLEAGSSPNGVEPLPEVNVGPDDVGSSDTPGETPVSDPPLAPGGEPVTAVEAESPAHPGRRPARVPVPSWDEIILGAKPSTD
ncbi:MAG: septation protein SepH [Dermatophilaceae bacterium]